MADSKHTPTEGRFEAWRKAQGLSRYSGVVFDYMLMVWDAAERDMNERAAKIADNNGCGDPQCRECVGRATGAAIRKLVA